MRSHLSCFGKIPEVIDMFTDADFMTAKEKELILKNWTTFLANGLKREHFTKRLYNHLHLHAGFIAHYNQFCYFGRYFESGPDTESFFDAFMTNTAEHWGANIDYKDINDAMREVYRQYEQQIRQMIDADVENKLGILDESIRRAKTDHQFGKDFLRKLKL
jgi:hypothetical protein